MGLFALLFAAAQIEDMRGCLLLFLLFPPAMLALFIFLSRQHWAIKSAEALVLFLVVGAELYAVFG